MFFAEGRAFLTWRVPPIDKWPRPFLIGHSIARCLAITETPEVSHHPADRVNKHRVEGMAT